MKRRAFLRSTAVGAGAAALAPLLPLVPAPAALAFHPDAFALAMAPLARAEHFQVGDVLRFGTSTTEFVVTAVDPQGVSFSRRRKRRKA